MLKGEGRGFRYCFRRFWLDIETLSGNWKMRVMACEHPFGYLLYGAQHDNEQNLFGFAETMYFLSSTLTTEQKLVDEINAAIDAYEERLMSTEKKEEDDEPEGQAIEEVKAIQEYVDATPKQKRKMERDINGRFKKSIKKALQDGKNE
jgi:hypothetical protein